MQRCGRVGTGVGYTGWVPGVGYTGYYPAPTDYASPALMPQPARAPWRGVRRSGRKVAWLGPSDTAVRVCVHPGTPPSTAGLRTPGLLALK